ncbi:WD repeat-containing protein 44-like protein [Tanacetum coccineum]
MAAENLISKRARSKGKRKFSMSNLHHSVVYSLDAKLRQMVKLPEKKMLRCGENLLRYACENSSFIHNGKYWQLDRAYYMADLLQVYATPETLLDIHPDIGAPFHLSRLLGEHLALIGETQWSRDDGVWACYTSGASKETFWKLFALSTPEKSLFHQLIHKLNFWKIQGNICSGSQMLVCFTFDGKHIISATDDSNVYVWNHISPDKLITKPKSNASYEKILSQNATMAIPWCGIKSIAAALPSPRSSLNNSNSNIALPRSTIDSPRMQSPSTTRGFFLESLLKGPPTWPAETLPDSTQVSVSPSMRKSEYKFLKSAYQSTFVAPHMWGLVIVAAGWDGRIRTYLNYGLPIRM